MNERFLAVCRKQQSSAHASSLARVSSNLPLSRTTHAPTTFSLPPGASLYPTHSPPCLSPLQATGALERERRLCSIGRAARYKGERQPLSRKVTVLYAVKTKAPNVCKSCGTSFLTNRVAMEISRVVARPDSPESRHSSGRSSQLILTEMRRQIRVRRACKRACGRYAPCITYARSLMHDARRSDSE